jgi:hypothetical protein
MVPALIIPADKLELLPNGKIDPSRLPDVEEYDRSRIRLVRPPVTETEIQVAGIWTLVLGRNQIGADENFFEAGGDSLSIVRVQQLLKERLNFDIQVASLFEAPLSVK